jgi:glycosidase
MAYADGDIEINSNEAKELGWSDPPEVDHLSSYKKLQLHLAYLLTIPGVPVIYYGDEIGMTGAADPDNRRMMRFDDETNIYEKKTKTEISKLINLRKKHSALRQGDFFTLIASEHCYAYIRSDMNERMLVVLNKSDNEQMIELNIPQIYDVKNAEGLSNGKLHKLSDGKFSVTIPAIGWRMYVLN